MNLLPLSFILVGTVHTYRCIQSILRKRATQCQRIEYLYVHLLILHLVIIDNIDDKTIININLNIGIDNHEYIHSVTHTHTHTHTHTR